VRQFFWPSPTSGVLEYSLNGVSTSVSKDTGTPANSRPLPVEILNSGGTPYNLATEPTLASVDNKLTTLNNKDFATQTTLASVDNKLTTLNNKDFATETTLSAVNANLNTLNAKDFATETTLASVDGKLTTLNNKDFATETTLSSVDNKLTTLNNKDFATETTLASVDTKLTTLNNKDFATETTLAAVDSKLTSVTKTNGGQSFFGAGGRDSTNTWIPLRVSSNGSLETIEQGRTAVDTARHSYSSTPVNTTNWQQLLASTSGAIRRVEIFDSSGQTLELGVGAPGSEVRQILVFPGGNGIVPLSIASGARVSIRAVSATANEGEISINFYS
jgi:peptidoglycan hydrolase CwlO-like protein